MAVSSAETWSAPQGHTADEASRLSKREWTRHRSGLDTSAADTRPKSLAQHTLIF